jgi:uncharacterized SAM-binding protein YcdF (DUF218 family)
MKFKKIKFSKLLRLIMISLGCIFLVLCILAFTTLPFYARHWLGTHEGIISAPPTCIVLLGGAGIPSEDGLMRSFYTAALAKHHPLSNIIIAIPGDTADSLSLPRLYEKELLIRGIQEGRITFENVAHNTRQQALLISESGRIPKDTGTIAIITSPEHMMRAILCFEKVGFRKVKGFPTFEISIPEDELYYNDSDLKGNRIIPGVGQDKQLRYQFWNHLRYEILVIREYFALGYYKLRSWI